MKFNTLYVSKWADGDPKVTRVIETPTFSLHSMAAGDSCDRTKVIAAYCRKHGISSVVLCPGFTHRMVADVARALEGEASVSAARSDGPGSAISGPVREQARKGLKN